MVSQSFGKYTIMRRLGSGGMAEVYLAHDPVLDRNVAIKVIHPYLVSEAEFEQRFRREARLVASLRHPNIVQVYEYDLYNGAPFMVMEYLGGGTLNDRIAGYRSRGQSTPLQEVSARLSALAAGLDYAHGRGLVHRDLKPGNILFTENDETVMTDFGIAKILGDASQMTTSGRLLGTPAYMSPEQASNKPIGKSSDIYSLGIIIYELVTGTVPFKGETTTAVMMQHLTDPPPPPRQFNSLLPDSVQAVILKALAKNAAERFATAGELARAFEAALSPGAVGASAGVAAPTEGTTSSPTNTAAPTLLGAIPSGPSAEKMEQRSLPSPKVPITNDAATMLQKVRTSPTRISLPQRGLLIAGGVGLLVLLLIGAAYGVTRLANAGQPSLTAGEVAPTAAGGGALTQSPTFPAASATAIQMPGMNHSNPSSGTQVAPAAQSFGVVRFSDATGVADQVVLSLTNIAPPPEAHRYEAWLVGKAGEARLSLGRVDLDKKGNAQLTFVDKDGQNLIAQFDRFELTLQPDPDASTLPSDIIVYSSAVPPGALMHIRHLLVAFDDTPNHIGLDVGLLKDARLVNQTTRDMLDANQKSDFERVLIDAESVVNVIEGKQGEHYGDLAHLGVVLDHSDGYGLLLNGKSQGYIEGAIDHASLAAASQDATEEIKMHAEHVKIASKNLEGWTIQLRDLGLQILTRKDNTAATEDIRNAAALGERLLNGIDLDGDERVDPVPGEAGALIAYEHAFYMADMPILPGPNAMPTPGAR